jgi:hypothetical protein
MNSGTCRQTNPFGGETTGENSEFSEIEIQRKHIQREIQSSPNFPKEKGEIVGRAGFPACSRYWM